MQHLNSSISVLSKDIGLLKAAVSLYPYLLSIKLFRQVLLTILFVSLMMVSAFAQSSSSFIGAELFYDNIDQSTINIVLKKMVACSVDEELKSETVTIHNSDLNTKHSNIELTLMSSKELISKSKYSCLNQKSCVKELIYSAEVDLGMQTGGYDITWGYGYLNDAIMNMDPMPRQAITLTCHVSDPWEAKANKGANLASKPMHEFCMAGENQLKIDLSDEEGDYVSVRIVPASSHTAIRSVDYYQDLLVKKVKLVEEKSFLTDCPPFEKMKYSDSYSGINPLGQNGSEYSKKEKTLTVEPDLSGKYLVAFEITEYRDKIKLTTHQAVIIFNITESSFK